MSNTKKPRGATPAGTGPALNRREQLRIQQEAEAKRKKTMRIISLIAALLALALIVVVGSQLVKKNNDDKASAAGQIVPPDASADQAGIVVNKAVKLKDGAPTLAVYQDYQCPACKSTEEVLGAWTNSLAAKGEIALEYRTMTFIEDAHPESNGSSTRAGIGAACADTVSASAYEKYHDTIYAHQPTVEGQGYTDEQLRTDFAAEAGITGADLTKFQSCYDGKLTQDFVKGTNEKAAQAKINSTPTYQANGKTIDFKTAGQPTTEAAYLELIKKAAAS